MLLFIVCELINDMWTIFEDDDLKKALKMHLFFIGSLMILCHIWRDMLPEWKSVVSNWSLTNLSSKLKQCYMRYQEESNEFDIMKKAENSTNCTGLFGTAFTFYSLLFITCFHFLLFSFQVWYAFQYTDFAL